MVQRIFKIFLVCAIILINNCFAQERTQQLNYPNQAVNDMLLLTKNVFSMPNTAFCGGHHCQYGPRCDVYCLCGKEPDLTAFYHCFGRPNLITRANPGSRINVSPVLKSLREVLLNQQRLNLEEELNTYQQITKWRPGPFIPPVSS